MSAPAISQAAATTMHNGASSTNDDEAAVQEPLSKKPRLASPDADGSSSSSSSAGQAAADGAAGQSAMQRVLQSQDMLQVILSHLDFSDVLVNARPVSRSFRSTAESTSLLRRVLQAELTAPGERIEFWQPEAEKADKAAEWGQSKAASSSDAASSPPLLTDAQVSLAGIKRRLQQRQRMRRAMHNIGRFCLHFDGRPVPRARVSRWLADLQEDYAVTSQLLDYWRAFTRLSFNCSDPFTISLSNDDEVTLDDDDDLSLVTEDGQRHDDERWWVLGQDGEFCLIVLQANPKLPRFGQVAHSISNIPDGHYIAPDLMSFVETGARRMLAVANACTNVAADMRRLRQMYSRAGSNCGTEGDFRDVFSSLCGWSPLESDPEVTSKAVREALDDEEVDVDEDDLADEAEERKKLKRYLKEVKCDDDDEGGEGEGDDDDDDDEEGEGEKEEEKEEERSDKEPKDEEQEEGEEDDE